MSEIGTFDAALSGARALALKVLSTENASAKAEMSIAMAQYWQKGDPICADEPREEVFPDRPARPTFPELLRPRDMPRRRIRGTAGRVALLHAIAHIELNAIDLAWDLVGRFDTSGMPKAFFDDWIAVGADEARHFMLLENRLHEFESFYGALPAHDGLWEAAIDTKNDLAARLAVVPMVLEARGLDVTPKMIETFEKVDDSIGASILKTIYEDEIGHVATGSRWFHFVSFHAAKEPKTYWQELVNQHFKGQLKPPFNDQARSQAQFPAEYYQNIQS